MIDTHPPHTEGLADLSGFIGPNAIPTAGPLPHTHADGPLSAAQRPLPPDPEYVSSMHGAVVESIGSGIALGRVTGTLHLDEIAVDFGVSRSLIREALRTLAAKGMVVARKRAGTRVTPATEWAALDAQVIRWRAAGADRFKQLHDSLEIRARLEPLAARRMALHGSTQWNTELQRATVDIRRACTEENHLLMLSADTAYHRSLYLGSGSELLAEMSETVHACLRLPDFQRFHNFAPETADRHDRLTEAVLAGDGDDAEQACLDLVALTRGLFTAAHQELIREALERARRLEDGAAL